MARKKPRALTPAKRAKVVKAVSLGLTRAQQAAFAGVSVRTLQRHIAKGREGEGVWAEWVEELEEAEARAVAHHLALIAKAASAGTWQASAWWLERKYPQEWARRTYAENRNENTGAKGGPQEVRISFDGAGEADLEALAEEE